MSKMTPIKVEYVFAIKNHRMKAVAEHCDLSRKFSFTLMRSLYLKEQLLVEIF